MANNSHGPYQVGDAIPLLQSSSMSDISTNDTHYPYEEDETIPLLQESSVSDISTIDTQYRLEDEDPVPPPQRSSSESTIRIEALTTIPNPTNLPHTARTRNFFTSCKSLIPRAKNRGGLTVEFDKSLKAILPSCDDPSWRRITYTKVPRTAETRKQDEIAYLRAERKSPEKFQYQSDKQYLKHQNGYDHIEFTTSVESLKAVPITLYRTWRNSRKNGGKTKIGSGTAKLTLEHIRSIHYIDMMRQSKDTPKMPVRDEGSYHEKGKFGDLEPYGRYYNDIESIAPDFLSESFPADLAKPGWLDLDLNYLKLDPKHLKDRKKDFIDVRKCSDTQDERGLPTYRLTFKATNESRSPKHPRRVIEDVRARRETRVVLDCSDCLWDEPIDSS